MQKTPQAPSKTQLASGIVLNIKCHNGRVKIKGLDWLGKLPGEI